MRLFFSCLVVTYYGSAIDRSKKQPVFQIIMEYVDGFVKESETKEEMWNFVFQWKSFATSIEIWTISRTSDSKLYATAVGRIAIST